MGVTRAVSPRAGGPPLLTVGSDAGTRDRRSRDDRTGGARRPVLVRRALAAIGAGGCAAALAGPGVASGAGVPRVDVVCAFSAQFDFSPPLSFNTTIATGRGLLSSCASPSGRYPRLKSGVVFVTKPLVATGCSPAPLTMTGPTRLLWNDGSESSFDIDISTDPRSGAFGINAVVISGTLRGARLSAVPAIVAQTGFCGFGGVRGLTLGFGVATLTTAAPVRAVRTKLDRRRLRGGR